MRSHKTLLRDYVGALVWRCYKQGLYPEDVLGDDAIGALVLLAEDVKRKLESGPERKDFEPPCGWERLERVCSEYNNVGGSCDVDRVNAWLRVLDTIRVMRSSKSKEQKK